MILPIVAFGTPVLKNKTKNIDKDYEGLSELIENMFETMYEASGVGLAAPQIGKSIRLFIVDASPFEEDDPKLKDFQQVFVNPEIIEEVGEEWSFNEVFIYSSYQRRCERKPKIRIRYKDEHFNTFEEEFGGIAARIIQHEYDHLEGVLFTDYLSPLKKRLLKRKLNDISKGNITVDYRMKFPQKKEDNEAYIWSVVIVFSYCLPVRSKDSSG